jgi:hypothetical protein
MKLMFIMRTDRVVLSVFFILLATVFEPFTLEGKNYLLICFSFLGILFLTLSRLTSFPPFRNQFMFLLLGYIIFSFCFNLQSSERNSLVYSVFFITSFVFYSTFLIDRFTIENYRRLLLVTFWFYFFGLIAGQIYVVTGQFSVVSGIPGFLQGAFGTALEEGGYRYYSLSSEPSYASFVVITIYYCYMKLDINKGYLFEKKNGSIFLALVYMIIMFRSSYGIVLLLILLTSYIGFSKTSISFYALIAIFSALFLVVESRFSEIQSISRLNQIFNNLDFNDFENSLFYADFNTYFRIAPVLYYFKTSNLTDASFFLGHGAGAAKNLIIPSIASAYLNGEYLGGFLPSFFYDYGIIGAGIVIYFVLKIVPKLISIPSIVMALLLLNANLNTQLFWFELICFSLSTYFINSKR